MVSNLAQLLENVDYFYKSAGLLKVPETVLKEASDWITTCYCNAVAEKIQKAISENKERTHRGEGLPDILDAWHHIVEQIEELRYAIYEMIGNPRDIEELDKFVEFIGIKGRRIPQFDMGYVSKITGLTGAIDTTKNFARLLLQKNDDGTFYIDFYIDFPVPDVENKTIVVDDRRNNLSAKVVILTLVHHLENIRTVLSYFESLTRTYETYDKQYLKNIVVVYGACKRLSQNFVQQEAHAHNAKRIEFPISDVPYIKDKKHERRNTATIYASLITSSKEANKLYEGGGFGGLWVKSDWEKWQKGTSNFIGSLYVYANMEDDVPSTITSLNEKIVSLQKTTRHETQHFVQEFIRYIQPSIGLGGVPGESIRNQEEYDIHGKSRKDFIGPHQDIIEKEGPHKGHVRHTLRDVEFYTRLSDAVSYFHKYSSDWPKLLHRTLMLYSIDHISRAQIHSNCTRLLEQYYCKILGLDPKKHSYDADIKQNPDTQKLYWQAEKRASNTFDTIFGITMTGINNIRMFFTDLRQYQPLKYRKAVAEYVKAIGL